MVVVIVGEVVEVWCVVDVDVGEGGILFVE